MHSELRTDHSNETGLNSRIQQWNLGSLSSICVYDDIVITCARTSISLWNQKGDEIKCVILSHKPFKILVWEKTIVACSEHWIEFLSISKNKFDRYNIQSKNRKIKCWKTLDNMVLWNDVLCGRIDIYYAVPGLVSRYYLCFWDKAGTYTPTKIVAGDVMKVHEDHLWICNELELTVWKKRMEVKNKSKELVAEKITGIPISGIYNFGFWGKERLVIATSTRMNKEVTRNLSVFSLGGDFMFKMNTGSKDNITILDEWGGKLVCCVEDTTNHQHSVVIFRWNGDVYKRISLNSEAKPICANDDKMLWYATKTHLCSYPSNWDVERLLWLGWKKNEIAECNIRKLPKELLLLLISYL